MRLVAQPVRDQAADGLVLLENLLCGALDVEQYNAVGRDARIARGFLSDRQGVRVDDEERRFGFLELVEELVGGKIGVCTSWVETVSL